MIKNLGTKKLSKTSSHRKAMLANMASSLLLHEEIRTTLPKAKELKKAVEHIITDARNGRHIEVRRVIKSKVIYKKLFDIIVPRYTTRPGGYTRLLRLGVRKGDRAQIALIKLV